MKQPTPPPDWNSALKPLEPQETVLILDPPRAGLSRKTAAVIDRFRPKILIYISCAPDTLARDCRRLGKSGYRIESSQIFDMFPRTPHFESLTLLRR